MNVMQHQCKSAGRRRPVAGARRVASRAQRSSFTLVELIVVVAIIGLLLTMVLPNASKMWSQRNEAATYNLLRGLLESARTQAIRSGERGLFFFLDSDGTQRVVFIRGEPPDFTPEGDDACDCEPSCCFGGILTCTINSCVSNPSAVDRFRVITGQLYTVPKPYRVAPDWVIAAGASSAELNILTHKTLKDGSGGFTPRYQKNHFAIIFNARGEVAANRNVLIHDPDNLEMPGHGDGYGDITRLRVENPVSEYWEADQSSATPFRGPSTSGNHKLFDIIRLEDLTAANFQSVAGLVVYDESDMEGLDGAGIAEAITRTGQPCFVSRYTGEVVFGKKGP